MGRMKMRQRSFEGCDLLRPVPALCLIPYSKSHSLCSSRGVVLLSRSLTRGLCGQVHWLAAFLKIFAWIVTAIAFPSTYHNYGFFLIFFAARPRPPLLARRCFRNSMALVWQFIYLLIGGGSALYSNVLPGRPSPSFFRRFLQDSFFFLLKRLRANDLTSFR